MKKTLRTLLMGMMAIVAGALTSCSNDDEPQMAPEGQKGYVEFTLSRGADTRTAYSFNEETSGLDATWSEGDQVVVVYGTGEDKLVEVFDMVSGAGENSATFSNPSSDLADKSGDLWILYFPGYDSNESISANTFDFSEQKGTLEDLGKYDYFTCKATLDMGHITPSAIKPSMTILRFPAGIDFGTGEGEMTKDIVFSGGRHILVPFENITEEQVGDIVVKDVKLTGGKLAADLYVSVFVSDAGKYAPTSLTVGGKVFIIPQVKERGLIYTFAQSNLKALEADPLTLQADKEGTITISNPNGLAISYVKNAETRVTSTGNIEISVAAGDVVRFYGDNAAYYKDGSYTNIRCTADCYIYGNIMSLIDADGYETATELTEDLTFIHLFENNEHIVNHDTKKLSLPATTLTVGCYSQMFRGCKGLTTAPALPATTLTEGCYEYMFCDCKGLTTAPELPAETLAEDCYSSMFSGCSSLETAPKLPATTLVEGCYKSMFNCCESLTTAPELKAIVMEPSCYSQMFYGCSSLEVAPELPAKTMAKSCYASMFDGCWNLTTAPNLPAETLAERCYLLMFNECWNLTTAPKKLPAETLAEDCYSSMFSGCSSLETAPELPAKILVNGCYHIMFNGCSSLNSVTCLATDISADGCIDHWLDYVASNGTFYKAESMTKEAWRATGSIPSDWEIKNDGEQEDPEED